MNRPLKTAFALAALALVALAVSVSPAAAKSKPACWQLVINDWYDGTISGKYQLHCYRQALKHLPTDSKAYSSAYDDINRALQRRIAEIAAAKKKHHQTPANGTSNSTGPTGPGASGPGNPPPAGSGVVPPAKHSQKTKHSTSNSNSNSNGNSSKQQSPKAGGGPQGSNKSATGPTTAPGRNQGLGPAQNLINKLGPDDATSLPIPLLVLAGLAMLLMFGGAITLVAKRAQARRLATVPVRSAESG